MTLVLLRLVRTGLRLAWPGVRLGARDPQLLGLRLPALAIVILTGPVGWVLAALLSHWRLLILGIPVGWIAASLLVDAVATVTLVALALVTLPVLALALVARPLSTRLLSTLVLSTLSLVAVRRVLLVPGRSRIGTWPAHRLSSIGSPALAGC
jgi:hypothetical protein